jgi:hypothetical protein
MAPKRELRIPISNITTHTPSQAACDAGTGDPQFFLSDLRKAVDLIEQLNKKRRTATEGNSGRSNGQAASGGCDGGGGTAVGPPHHPDHFEEQRTQDDPT